MIPFDPRKWPITWLVGAGLVIGALVIAWLLVTSATRSARQAAAARADAAFAEARTSSAKEAVVINDQAINAAVENEHLSQENANAIRQACPGPDCNRVARERLCNRASYRNSPECVQLLGRPQPAR